MARALMIPCAAILVATAAVAARSETPKASRTPAGISPSNSAATLTQRSPEPQWPRTLADKSSAPAQTWTVEEIETARAQCRTLLSGVKAVFVPSEPLRDGECGTPAPVELISIGSSPQVTFSPPAVVTCDLVAALDKWFAEDVQPAARRMLGGNVVRVEVMSSYSCRNAYGRRLSKLSEHGKANALDIRSFLTDRGEITEVLADWGLTERDIKARIAAAKIEAARQAIAAKREQELRDAYAKQQQREQQEAGKLAAVRDQRPLTTPGETIVDRFSTGVGLRGSITDAGTLPRGPGILSLEAPSRLGGPKQQPLPNYNTGDPSNPKQLFLRKMHASACQAFGTILGPEANEAHRNHLHIDMADRKTGSFCE